MRLAEFETVTTKFIIDYIRDHHNPNLHSDYLDHLSTFDEFELKDINLNKIRTKLSGLESDKVERYKKLDISAMPPIVIGDGNILDGYHRANVAVALGMDTIKAYVGVHNLNERELPKNSWEALTADPDKQEFGQEMVDLVRNAYKNTPLGSNVNSLGDVVPSDWLVLDWDDNPDVDTLLFYRVNRPGEAWRGKKIQGLGHDGQQGSKQKAIQKLEQVLRQNGWWIESSDALQAVLRTSSAPVVTDQKFLRKLFRDPDLEMVDKDTYMRRLTNGQLIEETVFGRPVI